MLPTGKGSRTRHVSHRRKAHVSSRRGQPLASHLALLLVNEPACSGSRWRALKRLYHSSQAQRGSGNAPLPTGQLGVWRTNDPTSLATKQRLVKPRVLLIELRQYVWKALLAASQLRLTPQGMVATTLPLVLQTTVPASLRSRRGAVQQLCNKTRLCYN